ncbi:MAG: CAP domain-containing protein [Halobacteriales archaeon]
MKPDSTTVLVGLVALVLVLAAYAALTGEGVVPDEEPDAREVETLLLDEVNDVRVERGLDRLERETALEEPARSHAEHMAEVREVTHEGADGETPFDRYGEHCDVMQAENTASTWFGRNVAYDDEVVHLSSEREVAEHLVDEWMTSRGHRETMLGDTWRSAAAGVAVTSDGEVYAAVAFCA